MSRHKIKSIVHILEDRDLNIGGDQKLETLTLGEIVSLEKSNKNVIGLRNNQLNWFCVVIGKKGQITQRVAEKQERESRASAEQSTSRQFELDRIALNLTNEEWIGLVDQVRANPTLSAELFGADVSEDTFSNVYNKIQRAVDIATAKDHHQQLKQSGETLESLESKKLKSSHSTEQLAELQETTSVSAGATIAAGDPISAVPSVSAASSIPAETPIAAYVSTTAGVSKSASVPIIDLLDSPPKATSLPLDPATAEQVVPLRKSTWNKSMARRRTLPRPSQSESAALRFDDDDPEA
nr:hypothetical protein [Tanacetum cinerariifolium]